MVMLSLLLFAPHAQLCYVSPSFGTVDCSRPGFIEMRETAGEYYGHYRPNMNDGGVWYARAPPPQDVEKS